MYKIVLLRKYFLVLHEIPGTGSGCVHLYRPQGRPYKVELFHIPCITMFSMNCTANQQLYSFHLEIAFTAICRGVYSSD